MKLTETECEQLAEEVFDKVIGPSLPSQWHQWVMQRCLDAFERLGIFPPPPVMIINDQLVYPHGEVVDERRRAIERDYAETMRKLERKEIVPLLRAFFIGKEYSQEHKEVLFSGRASHYWWEIMEIIERLAFATKKGRKVKVSINDYPTIALLAEQLVPVCKKLLEAQKAKTKDTTREILEFPKTDYPKPCAFLLSHLLSLEKALANKRFMERRKTLAGRARLLAAGLAGADYGLSLLMSVSIAAQGKRHPA